MKLSATLVGLSLGAAALGAGVIADGDTLLSRPHPDRATALGAPEGHPLTRKAQVLYPAPGVPALIRPGQEVVVRVRVRRAMTPPPGIPQAHVIAGWSARLLARGLRAPNDIDPERTYSVMVHQIRPEDEGFVYRVRLITPAFLPPGLYDLEFRGPGIFDRRPRSVRVLPLEPEALELEVVHSGARLWREAEALTLRDPAAVLIPSGALEALRALERWPLATFAVPGPDAQTACRRLSLSEHIADEVAAAARCPVPSESPDCLIEALGGAEALDHCGDDLIDYVRRVGPPAWASTLKGVLLLGLDTWDHPQPARASQYLQIGDRLLRRPPAATISEPRLGPRQRRWLELMVQHTDDLIVLGHHRPERWPRLPSRLGREALAASSDLFVTASGSSSLGPVVTGPATIDLRLRRDEAPTHHTRQSFGLGPGRLALGEVRPRREHVPVGLRTQTRADGGVELWLRRRPPGRLRLRLALPARPGGWEVEGEGARLTGGWPGGGDLCEVEVVIVRLELAEGSTTERVVIRPASTEPLSVSFHLRPERPVVSREVTLWTEGPGSSSARVFWDLGDTTTATGETLRHRYIRSGPARVCAVAVDDRGRTAGRSWELDLRRWETPLRQQWASRAVLGWGLILLSMTGLLMGLVRGNILARRRR